MSETTGLYEDLHQLGIVKSQYDFSRNWMGQSEGYFSSIKARRRELGTGPLIALYVRLDEVLSRLEKAGAPTGVDSKRQRLETICQAIWIEIQDRYTDNDANFIFDMRSLAA